MILLTLMKQEVKEKWQKIYVNSPKSDTLQDVITEVGKSQPSIGDRKVDRSSKSEISRFFTYIEVLNLLQGSVSVYKTYKLEFISACVQYRK